MNDSDYIQKLHKKNPGLFSSERISIRVVEFERIIRIAYNDGAADALEDLASSKKSSMPQFMQEFFGGIKSK
jgi:hypothetical protein